MRIADINTERLLAHYLGIPQRDHLRVVLHLVERTHPLGTPRIAAELGMCPPLVAQLCRELHTDRHLLAHHRWARTDKPLPARFPAARAALLTKITNDGPGYTALPPDKTRTAHPLHAAGYLHQRTLYTLTPHLRATLTRLTEPYPPPDDLDPIPPDRHPTR
ncbi:hypothetical protein ACWEKT_26715 [Nocardia takedensis]